MQQSLNERIGVRTEGMSGDDKTKWLLNYSIPTKDHPNPRGTAR